MAGQRLLERRTQNMRQTMVYGGTVTTHSPRCPIRLTALLTFCCGAQNLLPPCEIPEALVPVIAKFEFAIHEHVSFTV